MKKKIIQLMLLVFLFTIGLETQGSASQAASAKATYMKVIKKYKKTGFTMFVKYDAECTYNGKYPSDEEGYPRLLRGSQIRKGKIVYYDLNGDGKKECIVNAGGYFNIFTIKKKKVKYLGGIKQRNSDSIMYNRGQKKFIVYSYGGRMMQYYVFRIKNGVMKKVCMLGDQVLDTISDETGIISEYYYNDKKTSGQKYKKYYKKYVTNSMEIRVQ